MLSATLAADKASTCSQNNSEVCLNELNQHLGSYLLITQCQELYVKHTYLLI